MGLSDFTYVESLINEWFICTVGKRLIGPRRKGEWRTYEHDLTKDLNDILKKNEIDIAPGEDILEKIKARDPDFISLFYKI